MSLKAFLALAPVGLGGVYMAGGFGGGYERIVDRPPAQVIAALEDLDISRQPGSPGTDPAASGGVQPLIRAERTTDRISFVVWSGDKVATRMTAHLAPLDGGARTRVTATVERGDAPDEFVSPAFRSEGITLGLFTLALEGELDELAKPVMASAERCQEIRAQMLGGMINAGAAMQGDSLGQRIGGTAQFALNMHAADAELKRNGCPTEGNAIADMEAGATRGMDEAKAQIVAAREQASYGQPTVDTKPMLDVSSPVSHRARQF